MMTMDDTYTEQDYDESAAYEALGDPRLVMGETLHLVEQLRRATKRLGDALVAGGLPGREWRSPDAQLTMLSSQFPDITIDDLITRLAEFAAGHAPGLLRGGSEEHARLREEVGILYGVLRALSVQAQRLRMLPARERGTLPLDRALGDARVGTQLDLVVNALRDIESLAPFLAPLSAADWRQLEARDAEPDAWAPSVAAPPASAPAGAPIGVSGSYVTTTPRPAPVAFRGSAEAQTPLPAAASSEGARFPTGVSPAPEWPVAAQGDTAQAADAIMSPLPAAWSPAKADATGSHRRLRDFAPPKATPAPRSQPNGEAPPLAQILAELRLWGRANGARVWQEALRQRWLLGAALAFVLVLSVSVATLTIHARQGGADAAATHLVVAPQPLNLACKGKDAATSLTLRNPTQATLTWQVSAPDALSVTPASGSLKPGQSVEVAVAVKTPKNAGGTLAISASDGTAEAPYTITCS